MRESRGGRGLRERASALLERLSEPKEERPPPRRKSEEPGYVPDARDEGSVDGGSLWERVERATGVAPVQGDPTLDPANEPWELAMMAGWGDVRDEGAGHDSMFGVGQMATGEVDATQELVVDSGTPGTPLALGPTETIDNSIDHREELAFEDPGDWTAYL